MVYLYKSCALCVFQTILVGDSGVGKTSLLVQFDQGKFQTGSFAATVGIGFTVRYLFISVPVFDHCFLASTKECSANKLRLSQAQSLDFRVVVSAEL